MIQRRERLALIGNGKTFKGRLQEALLHAESLSGLDRSEVPHTLVAYAPPIPLIGAVVEVLRGVPQSAIQVASQSVSSNRGGMDTGGVPADTLADLGVRLGIINHSEQKVHLNCAPDYHKSLSLQIANALDSGLDVLLCCGEEKGDHVRQLADQMQEEMRGTLEHLSDTHRALLSERLMIAYEPGGVIGTGKTAPITQIRRAFRLINELLSEFGLEHSVGLLYGGGVHACNLEELHHGLEGEPDLRGYFVGEASVRVDEFLDMARYLESRVCSCNNDHASANESTACSVEPISEVKTNGRITSVDTPRERLRVAIVGFGEIGVATAIASAQDPTSGVDVAQIFNTHLSPEDAYARVVCSRYADPADVSYRTEDGEAYVRIHKQVSRLVPHESMEDAAQKLDDIDVVVFTVGEYTKDPAFFAPFLRQGRAKTVLVTCACAAADFAMVPGFNHVSVNLQQHRIIALGSCTGNCAVPILSVIEDQFGAGAIRGIYAVAPHSKTNSQEIGNKGIDPKKEGILGNLIPTSTGLSKLLQQPGFFQVLSESVEAVSVRTPTEDASLLCMSVDIEGADGACTSDVRRAFREASEQNRWRGIIGLDRPHGTKLFWKDRHACVLFEPYIRLLPKYLRSGERAPISTVTLMAAYANVFGYSSQVLRALKALRLAGASAVNGQLGSTQQMSLVGPQNA